MSKQNKKTKKNISRNTKKDKKRDKSNKNNNTYSGKGEYNPQSFKDMPLGTKIIAIICILILTVFPFIFIVVCISVVIFTAITENDENKLNKPFPKTEPNSSYSEYIYLDETENGWYETVSVDSEYDKKLEWDKNTNSYYDSDSRCYIWYDDVTNEWQYWFKNVSSDYGNYGWMKCGHNSWEIENKSGKWVPLPEKYDRNKLWYIN